jgi:ABC-2 type transport system permease protein
LPIPGTVGSVWCNFGGGFGSCRRNLGSVFLMPEFMQTIAKFSPMNWGLNAYYDIILRNSGIGGIAKEIIFLFLFYIAMVAISLFYERKQNAV